MYKGLSDGVQFQNIKWWFLRTLSRSSLIDGLLQLEPVYQPNRVDTVLKVASHLHNRYFDIFLTSGVKIQTLKKCYFIYIYIL